MNEREESGTQGTSFYKAIMQLHRGEVRAIVLNEGKRYPTVLTQDDLKKEEWVVF